MQVKLTLSLYKVKALKAHLGEDRVTVIGEPDSDGYVRTSFKIESDMDILSVLHAGQDHGLAIGLGHYTAIDPKKVSVTVA